MSLAEGAQWETLQPLLALLSRLLTAAGDDGDGGGVGCGCQELLLTEGLQQGRRLRQVGCRYSWCVPAEWRWGVAEARRPHPQEPYVRGKQHNVIICQDLLPISRRGGQVKSDNICTIIQ